MSRVKRVNMRATVSRTIREDVEITKLRISVAVRYDTEDMPRDFYGRTGDTWTVDLDVDSGKIVGWQGPAWRLHMKVVDTGTYQLYSRDGELLWETLADYVPDFMPGPHYGDYLILDIRADGTVANWTDSCRGGVLIALEERDE